jgi:hypothetical protein
MDSTLSLYDALISISIPPERAKAVVATLERDMLDKLDTLATKEDLMRLELATKEDLMRLELATKQDFRHLEEKMDLKLTSLEQSLEQRLALQLSQQTIKLGTMLAGGLVILFGALKLTA